MKDVKLSDQELEIVKDALTAYSEENEGEEGFDAAPVDALSERLETEFPSETSEER